MDIKYIKDLLNEWRDMCDSGRASTSESHLIVKRIKSWFKQNAIEFCAHNAGYLGIKRYVKYFNPKINGFITSEEYKNLTEEQLLNFEDLTEADLKK
jgi:hypothetical protein